LPDPFSSFFFPAFISSCGFGFMRTRAPHKALGFIQVIWCFAMTTQSEWPDPTWHIGQRDHLHALGVITSSFNQLEFVLLLFFIRYVVSEPKSGQKIFGLLSNYNIFDLIRDAINEKEADATAKEYSLHFLKGFEALEANRNFLAHSHSILNNPEQPHLTFGKGSRNQPDVWSYAHMTLPDLRKIADEMRDFWLFGSRLDAWIIAIPNNGKIIWSDGQVSLQPLPDKPPLPERLRTIPHGVLPQEKII
jgi:hypothetical protein